MLPLRRAEPAARKPEQDIDVSADLASEGASQFVAVCDLNEQTARSISSERETDWTTNWRELIGRIDAASVAVPTEAHCEIACGLLEAGIHVLVEKPISRTLDEADQMIEAAGSNNTSNLIMMSAIVVLVLAAIGLLIALFIR